MYMSKARSNLKFGATKYFRRSNLKSYYLIIYICILKTPCDINHKCNFCYECLDLNEIILIWVYDVATSVLCLNVFFLYFFFFLIWVFPVSLYVSFVTCGCGYIWYNIIGKYINMRCNNVRPEYTTMWLSAFSPKRCIHNERRTNGLVAGNRHQKYHGRLGLLKSKNRLVWRIPALLQECAEILFDMLLWIVRNSLGMRYIYT